MTAAKQRNERLSKAGINGLEGFFELAAANGVDLFNRLSGVPNRVQQVLPLGCEKLKTFFRLLIFLNSHHVHSTHGLEFFAQFAILILTGFQLGRRQCFKIIQTYRFDRFAQFMYAGLGQMFQIRVDFGSLNFERVVPVLPRIQERAILVPFRLGIVEFAPKLIESSHIFSNDCVEPAAFFHEFRAGDFERLDRSASLLLLFFSLLNLQRRISRPAIKIDFLLLERGQLSRHRRPALLEYCKLGLKSAEVAPQAVRFHPQFLALAAVLLNIRFDHRLRARDFDQFGFGFDQLPLRLIALIGKTADFRCGHAQSLFGALKIHRNRANAMIHVEHRLLRFLKLDREARFQRLAFSDQFAKSGSFFIKRSCLTPGQIHVAVELAYFTLQ